MDYIQMLLRVAPLAVAAVAIALFMEVYKKKIRGDKAKPAEIYWVAVFLTMGTTVSCYKGFDLPGEAWAIGLYFFVVYTAQFYIDMKGIKFLMKVFAKKKGVDLEGYLDD